VKIFLIEIKRLFLYHYCNLKKQNDPEMEDCVEYMFNTFITEDFGLRDDNFILNDIKENHNIKIIETYTEKTNY
jgi:hypothetical protein